MTTPRGALTVLTISNEFCDGAVMSQLDRDRAARKQDALDVAHQLADSYGIARKEIQPERGYTGALILSPEAVRCLLNWKDNS